MNKEEAGMIGFEIVAYAGEARSKLMDALNKAQEGNYDEAEKLVEEANGTIVNAHNTQSEMLSKEAAGEDIESSFIMMHGQDHLMTTLLLKDLMKHLIELYRRGE